MARRPDAECAGGCGRLLWRGSGSSPAPVCRACRAGAPVRRAPRCPVCSGALESGPSGVAGHGVGCGLAAAVAGGGLAGLRPRDARALTLRLGAADGVPRPTGEVAAALGVSQERVRQLQRRAVAGLLAARACA